MGHRRHLHRQPPRGRAARPCAAAAGVGVPAVRAGHGLAGERHCRHRTARDLAACPADRHPHRGGRAVAGCRRAGRAVAAPPPPDRRRHLGRADRPVAAGAVLAAQPGRRLRAGVAAAGIWPEPAARHDLRRRQPVGVPGCLLLPTGVAAAAKGAVVERRGGDVVRAASGGMAGAAPDAHAGPGSSASPAAGIPGPALAHGGHPGRPGAGVGRGQRRHLGARKTPVVGQGRHPGAGAGRSAVPHAGRLHGVEFCGRTRSDAPAAGRQPERRRKRHGLRAGRLRDADAGFTRGGAGGADPA